MSRLEAQFERDRQAIEQLQTALTSARTIGAALGIVMVSQKITQDQAFQVLRQFSQNRNVKLRDLADEVVITGVLPSD